MGIYLSIYLSFNLSISSLYNLQSCHRGLNLEFRSLYNLIDTSRQIYTQSPLPLSVLGHSQRVYTPQLLHPSLYYNLCSLQLVHCLIGPRHLVPIRLIILLHISLWSPLHLRNISIQYHRDCKVSVILNGYVPQMQRRPERYMEENNKSYRDEMAWANEAVYKLQGAKIVVETRMEEFC